MLLPEIHAAIVKKQNTFFTLLFQQTFHVIRITRERNAWFFQT